MGLLSFVTGRSKPFDAVAGARVQELETLLLSASEVSIMEPSD